MKLSNLNIDKTVAILLIIIFAGVVEVVIVGRKIVEKSAEVDQVQLSIQEEYARREKYDELIASYHQITSEGVAVDVSEVLPTADDFIYVVEELEQIGTMSGNALVMKLGEARLGSDGFEVDPNTLRNRSALGFVLPVDAGYDFIEIDVSVRGNFPNLLQFIHLLNQSKYYMNILGMQVNRVTSEEGAFIDTSITLQVFVSKVIYR